MLYARRAILCTNKKRKRIKELETCKRNRKKIKNAEELLDITSNRDFIENSPITDDILIIYNNRIDRFFRVYKKSDSNYIVFQYLYSSCGNMHYGKKVIININDLSDKEASHIVDALISGDLYLTDKFDILEESIEESRKFELGTIDMYDIEEYFDNILERVKKFILYYKTLLLKRIKENINKIGYYKQ